MCRSAARAPRSTRTARGTVQALASGRYAEAAGRRLQDAGARERGAVAYRSFSHASDVSGSSAQDVEFFLHLGRAVAQNVAAPLRSDSASWEMRTRVKARRWSGRLRPQQPGRLHWTRRNFQFRLGHTLRGLIAAVNKIGKVCRTSHFFCTANLPRLIHWAVSLSDGRWTFAQVEL